MMSNSNFKAWLKTHNSNTDDTTKKYVLHYPNGEHTVIRYAYLQGLCTKHFGEMASVAIKKLLAGESVMTEEGVFSIEVVEPINTPLSIK